MSERSEHLAAAKQRALGYVDAFKGDLALASFLSDMGKREDTARSLQPVILAQGQHAALTGDLGGLRRWIEGFG